MTNTSKDILSDITVHMKYAKYIPELNRRETWEELVTRNMNMHIKKYPELEDEIKQKDLEIKALKSSAKKPAAKKPAAKKPAAKKPAKK